MPDPQDPETFRSSVLNRAERTEPEHARLLACYRDLLALRRARAELTDPWLENLQVDYDEEERWIVVHRGTIRVACNLGADPVTVPVGGVPLMWWDEPVVNRTRSAALIPGHSFAVFDHTRTLTLRGTVTKFQWTNPHGFIEMDVKQDDGSVKHFAIELTSINMMQRVGWRSNMIKAGDTVQVVMAPLLSGEPVGLGLEVVLADGKTMNLPVPNIGSFKRTAQE